MCAPSDEELLVDSCFNKWGGEEVAYDEPVRLDAGDVGER